MLPPTLAEMTAWSVNEIEFEVRRWLPSWWRLECNDDPPFVVSIYDPDDAEPAWAQRGWDQRLLLLDAFGWLMLRDAPRPKDGPWKPRQRELTCRVVATDAHAFSDPPDLDPEVLETVYSKTPGKPGHGG